METGNVLERLDVPLVLCVGTSAEQLAAIAEATQGRAAVLYLPDQRALRTALDTTIAEAPPLLTAHPVVECGGLRLDPGSRSATWHGAPLALSAREFDLLSALAGEPGRVWTFAELTTHVWGRPYVGDTQAVVSAVKRLRRQLRAAPADLGVESVRGVGYRVAVPGGSH
ncbi:winged helix-turn-helix domain-containing protein [Actinokineospora spheciospongiae]|uniref:winged helix-turn-helix domain-containing protein n=1 Tax=Actinokineospora spheciospongiae TaxID=909613 RepID=UPI0011B5D7ED|nr:winged helix-turn-helix domain-containing protein [Actinokineospora spheciospongiae]